MIWVMPESAIEVEPYTDSFVLYAELTLADMILAIFDEQLEQSSSVFAVILSLFFALFKMQSNLLKLA